VRKTESLSLFTDGRARLPAISALLLLAVVGMAATCINVHASTLMQTKPDVISGASGESGSETALPGSEPVTASETLLGRIGNLHSIRVVIHARKPAVKLATQISSLLASFGVGQTEHRIVEAVPNDNQVRYYHEADREAGQIIGDVLALISDDVAVRNFQSYTPPPTEGLVEIWLRW